MSFRVVKQIKIRTIQIQWVWARERVLSIHRIRIFRRVPYINRISYNDWGSGECCVIRRILCDCVLVFHQWGGSPIVRSVRRQWPWPDDHPSHADPHGSTGGGARDPGAVGPPRATPTQHPPIDQVCTRSYLHIIIDKVSPSLYLHIDRARPIR